MIITLTILLFLCGIAGFILNRNNVILLIVAIELLLLAVEKFSCTTANYANSYLVNQPSAPFHGKALTRVDVVETASFCCAAAHRRMQNNCFARLRNISGTAAEFALRQLLCYARRRLCCGSSTQSHRSAAAQGSTNY